MSGKQATGAWVRVWSPVTRIFHWSLVTAFLVSYFGDDDFTIHNTAGYVVLGLILVRIPWGIFGPTHDRFVNFIQPPSVVLRYLGDLIRGKPERYLGHNPAGGWMILFLLVGLLVITVSGVLMNTDRFWGNSIIEDIHYYSTDVTLGLIALHILGVVASSLLHKENLIVAMITGRKRSG